MGLAQAARQEILAGISKTKVRYLGSHLTWNEIRINAARHIMEPVLDQVQGLQGNSSGRALLRAMCLCGAKRKLHRNRTRPTGSVPEKACEAVSGTDEKSLKLRAKY